MDSVAKKVGDTPQRPLFQVLSEPLQAARPLLAQTCRKHHLPRIALAPMLPAGLSSPKRLANFPLQHFRRLKGLLNY